MAARRDDPGVFRKGRIRADIPEEASFCSGKRGFHSLGDACDACGSDDGVKLGDLLENFILIALSHTACGDQNLQLPRLLETRQFENAVDTLFLGVVNKAAGIDNRHLCFGLLVRQDESAGT